MAKTIACLGGLALLHRFDTQQEIIQNWLVASNGGVHTNNIGCSVGIQQNDELLADKLIEKGCRIICVDVAHGHHERVGKFVSKLRDNHKDILIIAGNVATAEGANFLWKAGADIIKVGIGPGSLCTTRIETGNGVPQLSALDDVANSIGYALRDDVEQPMFIADGGIRNGGDCVKAMCFADLCMIGNLLAGTDEAPGDIITLNGKSYKKYAGSSTHKTSHVEGVAGLVPYRGSAEKVIEKLLDGITSGMSYQGVDNLKDLKLNPEFIEISNSGFVESKPHDVVTIGV
jgi:IMP dehydrogenase